MISKCFTPSVFPVIVFHMSEGFPSSRPRRPLSFFHVCKKTSKKKAGDPIPVKINYMALNVAVTHPVDAP